MQIDIDQSPPTHFDFMVFWDKQPFFFKCLLTFTYLLAVICMFTEAPLEYFSNVAIKTLLSAQIWRLFTSPFISLGMLHYTIAMINLFYILPPIQKRYSTAFLVIDFFLQNLFVQILFTLTISVVYDFSGHGATASSCSLWNILLVYLVKICMASPENQLQICCLPFKLRSKIYPFLMVFFFVIFTLPVLQLDIFFAIFLAVVQTKYFDGNFIPYKGWWLMKFENMLIKLLGERLDIKLVYDSVFMEKEQHSAAIQTGKPFPYHPGARNQTQVNNGFQEHEFPHNMPKPIILHPMMKNGSDQALTAQDS